jgi:sarcosine oxidase
VTLAGTRTWDVVVVGAGCFGSWAAWHLRRAGLRVALVDRYGAGNARSSSGGESRVIRMSYGADEVYTRYSWRSLGMWKELFSRVGQPALFQPTGVLWMARGRSEAGASSLRCLAAAPIPHERLGREEIVRRFPQFALDEGVWGIFEPESGALLARRAVQAVAADAIGAGVDFVTGIVRPPPPGDGRLAAVQTGDGQALHAGDFVFACGPWLGEVLPDVLGGRIFPTRQEVFYFGVPAGDSRFRAPAMPTWLDFGQEFYGLPDIESRGFKVACDAHGPPIDPDTEERLPSPAGVERARTFVAERFPALAGAPVVESRVCQYENTSSGDFVIDRHPERENVWMAGGGSGHGFKHGPAVGEHVAARVLGKGGEEPRFRLAGKEKLQSRTVF